MAFQVRLLQVMCGDAIIIKYKIAGKSRNILIDGGYLDTYTDTLKPELRNIVRAKGTIDFWILTHLDADHINGFVSFMRDQQLATKVNMGKLWFNCFDDFRIPQKSALISVGKGIEIREAIKNTSIQLDTKVITGDDRSFDNIRLQVLTPDLHTYEELRNHWKKEEAAYRRKKNIVKAGRKSGHDYHLTIPELAKRKDAQEPKKSDITNRSSISFILNIEGKRFLFLGDAYPSAVIKALSGMRTGDEKIKFDYVKLSHHGSRKNFSKALLDIIDCENFMICSNGTNQHFIPDKETLAKIICHSGRDKTKTINFIFNYDNPTLRGLFIADDVLRKKYNFKCLFPAKSRRYYQLAIK